MTHFDLNDYKIIEELGIGGMAKVYKAVQLKLDRTVVIKELNPSLCQDPDFRERFSREAKISAKLSHPNIIQIYDVVVEENGSYLSIEYIENGDLSELMQSPIEINTVIQLVDEMCNALDYAHGKGVIHRDVKTQNILIRANGSFVLADFGIAKACDMETQMTVVGSIVGSPKYMSPEQAQGGDIDSRSDFYSLGIVLFEILNGSVPFSGGSSVSVALKHISEPIPELAAEIRGLTPFFLKILAKSPDDRYQNGQEVIQGFLQGLESVNEQTIFISNGKSQDFSPSKLSSLKSKSSYIANKQNLTQSGERASRIKWISLTLAVTVSIAGIWYYYKWNSSVNQQLIQEKMSAAYQNLQTNKYAEALVLFNAVLEVDESNGMAKESIILTKNIFIDELWENLKQENYAIIEEKLNSLDGKYTDDAQIAEFTLQFEQAKFIKSTQQNIDNKIAGIKVLAQRAQQKRAFVYPDSDNAAEYLQEILQLQPNDEYAKQQLDIVNRDAITQIQQEIVNKELSKSEVLLAQYGKYFGETLSFNNLQKLLEVQYQAQKEVNAERELSKQKIAIALIELERQILTFDTSSTLPEDIDTFYSNVSKHIRLGGESTRLIAKVKLVLATQIRLLDFQLEDLLTFKHVIGLNEHPLIGNNAELKGEIEKYNGVLTYKRNDKKSADTIYAELKNINEVNDFNKRNEFAKYITQLQGLQIDDSAINLLKVNLSELSIQSIERLIEQTHFGNAKKKFNYSTQQNNILAELGLLEKAKSFENKLSSTEKKVEGASKKVMLDFNRAIDDTNKFSPDIANSIDQLQRALTNNLSAQNEITKLTETFYSALLVKLKALSESHHYQEFNRLYSESEDNFSKFPANDNTKKQIATLVQNTHLYNEKMKKKISEESNQIEQLIKQIRYSLNNNQVEDSLNLLAKLKQKNKQYQLAGFNAEIADIERQTLQLLISTIDSYIESKDKKSGEALVKQSLSLFKNDRQLMIRKNKLEELQDKKIKLIGF